ncbi:ArnT family glycosyltransferase [Roseivirga pacifica]|uniref:ArnT family glycosyltransferase n=1 Tax=Roseivirga pacifica TaxID=1267423 RepID=UPI002095110F|nr:glycosyltransferase family 39 protein [Roseivirga pacifica]MCO6357677.1 phospholipid carrier-dependent glycosyltransferase [Roseivirga pacifica]MCO6365930.1 phospholipid carrier-dependent glycosyltransferase [Roseivirga pacifica]MCO6371258.1 phospholipid carrier-dependent glycosyltransferase [Roseivirga pacifica]MCO6375571.1 phospholipid carrier-dependent glycosyltransferase [Roseivirga pacifica]MCO6378636.1 phospholipid carrier-dependent glycosyltransferase [Roseivirga pacifica]
MEKVLSVFSPDSSKPKNAYFLFILIAFVYFYNFHVNDIWTPNESFYADAVREMFESGNFIDIKYNYEPRYNKPPFTYWAIAASSAIFGLNEFGIRLPIVLMALGSIWLTYLLGKRMYGQSGGFYAMIIMALGLQLLAVKQYASPEVPLTYFFTLTMYWFYRGYEDRSNKYLMLSYIALGLTVLTKGFPYIIVIGGIVGFYVLLKNWGQWKQLWKDIVFLKLPLGVLIVCAIGLSWVIFMYIKDGQAFWDIYYTETFGRALEKKSNGMKPFFYIGVLSWTIVPYSLTFFYAVVHWVIYRKSAKQVLFPIAWVLVMLVIFTVSKGKIPTYIIQAHPALALMIVPMFIGEKTPRLAIKIIHFFISALLTGGIVYLILELNLSLAFMLIPAVLVTATVMFLIKKQSFKFSLILPFWAMFGFMIVFSSFLPKMEVFRPYDTIGEIITQKEIDRKTPLLLDAWLIQNLPYYAERHTLRDYAPSMINEYATSNETLAFLPKDHLTDLDFEYELLWEGMIYNFSSESQFFKYVMAVNQALKGNTEKFATYALVYKP